MNVGTMYIKHGQKEKARDYFKGALEIDPKLEEAKRQLIRLKKRKKSIGDRIEDWLLNLDYPSAQNYHICFKVQESILTI